MQRLILQFLSPIECYASPWESHFLHQPFSWPHWKQTLGSDTISRTGQRMHQTLHQTTRTSKRCMTTEISFKNILMVWRCQTQQCYIEVQCPLRISNRLAKQRIWFAHRRHSINGLLGVSVDAALRTTHVAQHGDSMWHSAASQGSNGIVCSISTSMAYGRGVAVASRLLWVRTRWLRGTGVRCTRWGVGKRVLAASLLPQTK